MMKAIFRDYPIGAVALLLLACVKFEYQHLFPLIFANHFH